MKKSIIFLILIISIPMETYAQDAKVYPTHPGTSIRDYSKPGVVIDGDKVYPTHPGTSIRDYSKPGAVVDGNKIYPTHPGTSIRDFSKPGYTIEPEK